MRGRIVAMFALVAGCALGSGEDEQGSAALGDGTDGSSSGRGPGADGPGDDGPSSDGSSNDGSSNDAGGTVGDDGPGTGDGPSASCGDGVIDPGETCDDGNVEDGDGCNADCRSSGQLDWEHLESGRSGQDDEIWDVAEAPDGNVYAVGFVRDAAGSQDGWFRKINPLGGLFWTELHDGPAAANDQIRAVVVDTSGLVVVAGYHSVTGQGADLWIRQYDDTGDPQWTDTWNGDASSSDAAAALAIDPSGDIVVVGHTTTVDQGRDVLLRKYSAAGAIQWTRTYSGAAGAIDQGWGVTIAASGEIYAVGYEEVTGEGRNSWLGKYDVDGNLLWSRVVNGDASLNDELRGVAASEDGVVVCGLETEVDIPWQSFVRKYDAAGATVWTERYLGSTAEGALCNGIARDPGGDLVWTGAEVAAELRQVVLRRLDPDGNERWTSLVPLLADGPDHGRGIEVASDGGILVGGRVDAGVDGLDVWAAGFTP